MKYKFPSHLDDFFNCPHCGICAHQEWYDVYSKQSKRYQEISLVEIAYCSHCDEFTLWIDGKMIFPYVGNAPLPNPDLPKEIKKDFMEARSIVNLSPRGATALLRLVVQKLCIHLGEEGRNLNQDIGNLVQRGLPSRLQKAMDSVRIIGNEAVHPGVLDIKDNKKIAQKMFTMINIIADSMITQNLEIDKIYKELPKSKTDSIVKRDNK